MMTMKRTILSEKESRLLENLIANYGSIVTFKQIYSQLEGKITEQAARNLVAKMVKNGWLVTIKAGTYAIASIDSRSFVSLSTYKIAQVLDEVSYVSLEAALQYHGMFDQLVSTVTSVTLKKRQAKTLQRINYKYIKTKNSLFYGFEEKQVENYSVKIATPEKAILDFINFKRSAYFVDLVLEKLKDFRDDFNFERLCEYSNKQSLTVKRVLGFLLDQLDIDSSYLYDLVRNNASHSKITAKSNTFNAKWRLYYEDRFTK
ncbi:MAG: hypothetical protein C4562_04180 [Actinobacteria bacterium]|nr:MAG: hypothetical protein C4562_04180 [Actinomycetota bacterium]